MWVTRATGRKKIREGGKADGFRQNEIEVRMPDGYRYYYSAEGQTVRESVNDLIRMARRAGDSPKSYFTKQMWERIEKGDWNAIEGY